MLHCKTCKWRFGTMYCNKYTDCKNCKMLGQNGWCKCKDVICNSTADYGEDEDCLYYEEM